MQLRGWSPDLSSYRKTWSNTLWGSIKFHDKTVEGNAIIFKPHLYVEFYSFSDQTFLPKGNVIYKLITKLSEQMCTLSCCFQQQEVWRHFETNKWDAQVIFLPRSAHLYMDSFLLQWFNRSLLWKHWHQSTPNRKLCRKISPYIKFFGVLNWKELWCTLPWHYICPLSWEYPSENSCFSNATSLYREAQNKDKLLNC